MNPMIYQLIQEINGIYGIDWDEEVKGLFAESVIMTSLERLEEGNGKGAFFNKTNLMKLLGVQE
jgi:hypothetical protein